MTGCARSCLGRPSADREANPVSETAANSLADRLDKWLWAVRLFRSRALAADACRAGAVEINETPAKPSRTVRSGETIVVRQGLIRRSLRVIAAPRSRVGAKLVALYCEDLTPPEEFAQAKAQPVQQFLAREKGSGRPTKRDRRLLDQLFD